MLCYVTGWSGIDKQFRYFSIEESKNVRIGFGKTEVISKQQRQFKFSVGDSFIDKSPVKIIEVASAVLSEQNYRFHLESAKSEAFQLQITQKWRHKYSAFRKSSLRTAPQQLRGELLYLAKLLLYLLLLLLAANVLRKVNLG